MSRFLLAFSFIAALSTGAGAQRFAEPPTDRPIASELGAPSMRMAPPTRSEVRAKLAQQRKANLARFRAYQAKGVFPSNTYTPGKLNVWTDDAGHLCAAATIINASGFTELVKQVAADNNFIRLADVADGPLMDWILTSGLTQAEIAAIQEPFIGVGEPDPNGRYVGMRRPVSPPRRADEDARLKAKYKTVEAMIVKQQNASLDAATDRLMAQPSLAWTFVHT